MRLRLASESYVFRTIGQDVSLPKLLVFHDSFYSGYFSLSHLMEPHFRTITGILYPSDPNVWSLDWIAQEKPDFVIIEIVERNFEMGLSTLLETNHQ